MFGIGMPEMILILAIALIVIGPQKLPDLAKSLGRAMREFKKATNEFKETISIDDDFKDAKHSFDSLNQDIRQNLSTSGSDKEPVGSEKSEKEADASDESKEGAAATANDGPDTKPIYDEFYPGPQEETPAPDNETERTDSGSPHDADPEEKSEAEGKAPAA